MTQRRHPRVGEDRDHLESPLGLTDEAIIQTPGDHLENSPDPEHARRLTRALGEDGIDHHTTGLEDRNVDADGAAGIDMGYGGEGTDVKP